MDQEVLVRSDIEIRGRILDALNRTGIPVTLCEWHYVPQLGEWQLIVATPWYDSRGPRVTYDRIIKALQQTGVYEDVPLRQVFFKSPSDPIVKQLEIEVKNKTEGVIHIIDHGGQYSVLFAPFTGSGGAVPAKHISNQDELRRFLLERIRLAPIQVDEALSDLLTRGSTSISSVRLTRREVKNLGLG